MSRPPVSADVIEQGLLNACPLADRRIPGCNRGSGRDR